MYFSLQPEIHIGDYEYWLDSLESHLCTCSCTLNIIFFDILASSWKIYIKSVFIWMMQIFFFLFVICPERHEVLAEHNKTKQSKAKSCASKLSMVFVCIRTRPGQTMLTVSWKSYNKSNISTKWKKKLLDLNRKENNGKRKKVLKNKNSCN